MVLAEYVRLISQGRVSGCERRERVCGHVGDNRPFSTPLSALLAHSWHTAGHPSKLSFMFFPTLHSGTTQPPYRLQNMYGKGGYEKKKQKNINVNGEE